MRRVALTFAAILGIVALTLAAVAAWLRLRDPIAALPRETTADLRSFEQRGENREDRLIANVLLQGSEVGPIRFLVSMPDRMPSERVPLMIIIAGRRATAETLWLLGDVGPNAVIWFEWPFPRGVRWGRELPRQLPELYRLTLAVPGQVDAVLGWASQQPWVDPDRISLLGFSLGSLVVPAAQRLAEERGMTIGWTVLAYGGAPIGELVQANPRIQPWLRPVVGAIVDLLLRPIEPAHHLPELEGQFLLLGGRDDETIPLQAAERMRALTPPPRTVVLFEGVHLGLQEERRALLDDVVTVSMSWLVEHGAIEPRR